MKQQPGAVVFRFSEPVEGNFGAVRVYDAEGERVDEGDAFHPDGEGPKLGVHLKPGLPDGSYTATYRVVSADGHIVSGGYVFSIGKAGRAPEETVAELVAGRRLGHRGRDRHGRSLAASSTRRWRSRSARSPSFCSPGGRRGGCWAARASAGSARAVAFERRLRIVLLVAAAAGRGQRRRRGRLRGGAGGRDLGHLGARLHDPARGAGHPLRHRLGVHRRWPGCYSGLGRCRRFAAPAPWRVAPLFVPLAFIALEPALSGHPSTQSPVALLFPANVLHVVGDGGLGRRAGVARPDPARRDPRAGAARIAAA